MFVTIKARFDKQAKKAVPVTINIANINYIGNSEVMLNKGLLYLDEENQSILNAFLSVNDNNYKLDGADYDIDDKNKQSVLQKVKNLLHNRSKN